ncbi:MAG: hypothetical protein KZQ65_05795 [Candidatus Thiodiazotropha sp. (ex Gloverina cf. vestifex)]|nr:hypothetical protein [Candidatus Thiodiazotropha sp. (ex Gloverina cf. vestifex)]
MSSSNSSADDDRDEVRQWLPPDVHGEKVSGQRVIHPPAAPPTAAALEQIQKQAYEEGYEKGKQEGFEFGHKEGLAQADQEVQRFTSL